MSNEIQLYTKLQPADVISMGMMLGKSGSFGMDKSEQGVTALMVCMCDNISLATFMRTYHVMPGGKFSKKAMAAFAEFRKLGGKIKWLKTGDEVFDKAKEDERKATAHVSFEGNELEYSYSIADAKREKVWKAGGRYETRPGQVLRARVITNVLGMLAPEIFAGEDEGDYITPEATLDLKAAEVSTVVTVAPKESESELAAVGLAPVKPATATKTTEAPKTATAPVEVMQPQSWPAFEAAEKDGKLTKETTDEICKRVSGRNVAAVLEWLAKSSWTSGDLDTLSLARAKKIISAPEAFLQHCKIGQPAK